MRVIHSGMESTTIVAASGKRSRLAKRSRSSTTVTRNPSPGASRPSCRPTWPAPRMTSCGGRLDRLDEDLHLPSANQAGLLGEVVRQLVLHEARLVRAHRLSRLAERIALVAAAADRANHPSVGVDQHLRAHPLRRRSARRDNRHERNRLALRERLAERGQQFRGHGAIIPASSCRAAAGHEGHDGHQGHEADLDSIGGSDLGQTIRVRMRSGGVSPGSQVALFGENTSRSH